MSDQNTRATTEQQERRSSRRQEDTVSESSRTSLYPPSEDRRAMRRQLAKTLLPRPAEFTATSLVRAVREQGSSFSEAQLKLELSRMLGPKVRMNPNRTLTLLDQGTAVADRPPGDGYQPLHVSAEQPVPAEEDSDE